MGICDFFVCTQLETQLSTNAATYSSSIENLSKSKLINLSWVSM